MDCRANFLRSMEIFPAPTAAANRTVLKDPGKIAAETSVGNTTLVLFSGIAGT